MCWDKAQLLSRITILRTVYPRSMMTKLISAKLSCPKSQWKPIQVSKWTKWLIWTHFRKINKLNWKYTLNCHWIHFQRCKNINLHNNMSISQKALCNLKHKEIVFNWQKSQGIFWRQWTPKLGNFKTIENFQKSLGRMTERKLLLTDYIEI